ncbi:MAG TPA: tetratricopeptide repeat protein [Planctomycetota bacterium]|nr:tetratricopeptide repeat protein [Planctomycetota bacterium]
MKYLYGDSTPSPLDVNFIQCLRETVDFAVQILQTEQQMQVELGRAAERRRAADAELAKVEGLPALVQRALEHAARSAPESPSGRAASAVIKSALELSRGESERAKAAFAEVLARLEAQVGKLRESCQKALEKLLLKQDLVDARTVLNLQLRDDRFEARLSFAAPYGVEGAIELDVPATHAFAKPVRLDQFIEHLELETPEGSWLSKETKLRPQRLDKYYVSELSMAPDQLSLKLRQGADGSGRGFDARLRRHPAQALIFRADDPPKTGEQPLEVKSAELPKFLALWDALAAGTAELLKSRRVLLLFTMDGRILKDHERPSWLVERMMARMGPIVQEIAKRSPSPNELVLKRLVGDDRREEIFVSKDELRKKLEGLTPEQLRILTPLGLFPPTNGTTPHAKPPSDFRPVEDPAAGPEAAPVESPRAQAEVFHKRGISRMKVGEVAAALSDFDRALQLRPDYPEAFANRASARQSNGDPSGAVSDLEASLKAAPSGWKHRERIEHLLEVARQHVKPKA